MTKPAILVVDHDAVEGEELAARLREAGPRVVELVSSLEEAAVRGTEVPPDVILVRARTADAAQASARRDRLQQLVDVPLMFVTDEADEAMLRDAGLGGRAPYLVTPFTDRELLTSIELASCRHDMVREARKLEDRFFALSVDMLCFLDFNGYFRRLNPAWERTLGFSVDELMSRPFIEFVHPDDRERTLRQNREVRHGGRALGFENRYLCKDGSYRWFLWNAAPDVAGSVIYSVARDVTARKKEEQERDRLVTELTSALAEVQQLQEILPICSYCKKIRDDENYWQTVESYLAQRTKTRFSHGICPSCMTSVVQPQLEQFEKER